MMLKECSLFVVLTLCAVMGCRRETEQTLEQSIQAPWRLVADSLMKSGFTQAPSCGQHDESLAPSILLPLAAKHCASCMDIGYLVRTLRKTMGNRIVIAAQPTDVAAVCAYLRVERTDIPVYSVADTRFESVSAINGLILLFLTQSGALESLHGRYASDILANPRVRTVAMDSTLQSVDADRREVGTASAR